MFEGRRAEVDREALTLIRRHCKTSGEFAAAAGSLIALGVPAEGGFLRAAREGEGMDKDGFCSALGHIGGPAAIGALCEVVADRAVPDERRKYAVMALWGHSDARIAPASYRHLMAVSRG